MNVIEPENPFAMPPTPRSRQARLDDAHQDLTFASRGARFANLCIDCFAWNALFIVVAEIVSLSSGGDWEVVYLLYFFGAPFAFLYYFVSEAVTYRTLGKVVTRTKVVNRHGYTPTTGQVFGRSLCRFIPFEAITFLGSPHRGWHDRLSKTHVVKVP